MILPIGDIPNPRSTPWCTYALIAANVLIFLYMLPLTFAPADPRDPAYHEYLAALADNPDVGPVQLRQLAAEMSQYDLVVFEHGFRPAQPSFVALLTGMFLHAGWLHLLGNMLFLWIYGDNVEERLGRVKYVLAYLGSGLVAGISDGILRHGSNIPAVGASGAISGVLGAYFVWFPANRVRLFVLFFPFLMRVIEVPARIVLALFVIVDNLLPWILSAGSGAGVAYGAHLGGFAAGLALAVAGNRRALRRDEAAEEPPPLPRAPGPLFRTAVAQGRLDEARAILFEGPRSAGPGEFAADDEIALGEALEHAGRRREALAVFQRLIADHARHPARPRAHLGAARTLAALGYREAALQHLYACLDEPASDEERTTARHMLASL